MFGIKRILQRLIDADQYDGSHGAAQDISAVEIHPASKAHITGVMTDEKLLSRT